MKTKNIITILLLIFSLTLFGCTPNNEDVTNNNGDVSNNNGDVSNNNGDDNNEIEYNYYTVTFDSNGGEAVESAEVLEGNPVRRPEPPTLEGFTFKGWYTTSDTTEGSLWDFDVDRVTSDITLYAGWTLIESEEFTESLTFELENGSYVVTGVGDDTSIIVPSTYEGVSVTAIGESAFARKDITRVILPDSITEIRLNAFNNCSSLEMVYISENSNLESIGNNAFSGNSNLKSIYIPKGMTSLGDSVFNNCGQIERFVVANDNAVYSSLGGHLIEKESMTLIRGSNNDEIPAGVITIAQAAFRRSTLQRITIPASVEEIKNYAFDDCDDLREIIVNEGNNNFSSLDGILYNKNQTELIEAPLSLTGEITLSEALIQIPQFAFDGRSSIEALVIPKTSLERINNFAFRNTTLTIKFQGTEEEWNEIQKAAVWGGNNLTVLYEANENTQTNGILVVYFSRTGNTREVAEIIANVTSASLVEITPETAYVSDYNALLQVARTELNSNSRPTISSETLSKINIDDFETIFICYPIWHGYEPMIIRSFIDNYDLTGKTIYPVSTSGSSGGSSAYNSIKNIASSSTVPSYLHFTSSQLQTSEERITNWIAELGLEKEANAQEVKVKMSFNNNEITMTLIDSAATQDLVKRLEENDITLEFRDYGSSEKIAYPNPSLDTTDTEGCDPVVGDVTIYVPWGNIAIFYVDSSGYSSSLVKLGTIDNNGIELLQSQSGTFNVTLSLVR